MNKMVLVVLPFMTACADLKPYVGYTHFDSTPFRNDDQAWDFLCGGAKYREGIELSVGACKDIRGDGFFRLDAEYVWRKK